MEEDTFNEAKKPSVRNTVKVSEESNIKPYGTIVKIKYESLHKKTNNMHV